MIIEINSVLFLVQFIVFVLTSTALTSGWLTSPLFDKPRNWLSERKSKISNLSICALCAGFWFSNLIQWIFVPFMGVLIYVGISLASSFIIWLLYSLVNMTLWIKAYYEQEYIIETKWIRYDNRNNN